MATAVRNNPTRQDTFRVRLSLEENAGSNTFVDYGVWDKKTGGELDSDELKYHPGGMQPAISLGGKKLPGNITLQREYDIIDDNNTKVAMMMRKVGTGRVKVHQHPMDFDGNLFGKAVHWDGILKKVQVPDVDSEGNAAALMEIEISVDGHPTVS